MTSYCCGPTVCDVTREEYICQSRLLLPDFQGKLDPDGDFLFLADHIAGFWYDCVIQPACDLEKEFNACTSEIYTDRWIEEFNLPIRCPLQPEIDAALRVQLITLQLCLQVQIQAGAVFNRTLLDQIADVLGISYTVKVPTYDLSSVPACDIVPFPPSGNSCAPSGCVFRQGFYVCVTCAPSQAHIDVFECFIGELAPCHVTYCVVNSVPNPEMTLTDCPDTVLADCVGVGPTFELTNCPDTVEAD